MSKGIGRVYAVGNFAGAVWNPVMNETIGGNGHALQMFHPDTVPPVEKPAEILRLNLGAGTDNPIDGYIPVDRKLGSEIFPLSYPDESATTIRASHCLEHLSYSKTLAVLLDWMRVLKPGGNMRIAVPDFDVICRMHLSGQRGVEPYVMGGHTDENDHHHAIFTETKLRMLMRGVGLRRIRRWKSELKTDCAALPVSLNLEGYKPDRVDLKAEGVHVIMSMPRYVLSTTFIAVSQMLSTLHLPTQLVSGPYWHQLLTQAIEGAIKNGAKYVLAIDGDTAMYAADVLELYRLIESRPDVDAVAALQMARGLAGPLCTFEDAEGKPVTEVPLEWFEQDLVKCRSAHFGLTLLRCDKFAKLPKPWFQGRPDPDGGWNTGRIDADVAFWLQWNAAGNTLYTAPLVHVGHVEEVVLHCGRDLKTIVQSAGEWRSEGMPIESIR